MAEHAKGEMGIREGESVLFLHTGGTYGAYAKVQGIAAVAAANTARAAIATAPQAAALL